MKKVLSYEERIELAKKLIEENKPVRLICKKTHFTPNKISDLRKELTGQSTNSKCTKAYQLFEEYDKLESWNADALLKVSTLLDLQADLTLKYYQEFLNLKRHDRLREVHKKSEQDIDSLLALHEALRENQIPEDYYPTLIQKAKNVIQLTNQESQLKLAVKNAKTTLWWLNSRITQANNEYNDINFQLDLKTRMIVNANREYVELNERNKKFRALIEPELKKDIKPLMLELVRERRDFDTEELLSFVESLPEAIIRVIQLYPELFNRFATNNYTEIDLQDLRVMLKNEAYDYVVQWLDDPTKWRTVIPYTFPLDI